MGFIFEKVSDGVDVSASTVTADALLEGISAYDANGNLVVGTFRISHNGIIPDGGTYTTADGTVYEAGSDFPETVSDGDVYAYGDYEYKYNYWSLGSGEWWHVDQMFYGDKKMDEGWGVRVLDNTQSSYGQLVAQINKKPLTNAPFLFYNNTVLKSASHISLPGTLKDLNCIFWGCTSLTSAPIIPSSVYCISGAFAECTSLTGNVQIDCGAPRDSESAVSTEIWVDKNIFRDTAKPIKITGKCTQEVRAYLAATANNGNVTYDITQFAVTGAGSWEVKNVTVADDGTFTTESLGVQDFNTLSYAFDEGLTWKRFLSSVYNVVIGGQSSSTTDSNELRSTKSGRRLIAVDGTPVGTIISMERAIDALDVFEYMYVLTLNGIAVQLTDTIVKDANYVLVPESEYGEESGGSGSSGGENLGPWDDFDFE